MVTENPADALAATFEQLSQPLTLVAYIVFLLVLAYATVTLVNLIAKKRGVEIGNPFIMAKRKLLAYILTLLGVFGPIFLLFAIYFPVARTVWGMKLFWPLIIIAALYLAVVSPTIPAVILGRGSARANFSSGLITGKRHWWRLIITLAVLSLILTIIAYLFGLLSIVPIPFLAAFLLYLYQAMSFLSGIAAVTELYLLDIHGE